MITNPNIISALVVALVCLASVLAIMASARVLLPALDILRRWRWSHVVLIVVFCGLVQYAATKGKVKFPYTDVEQRYLTDSGSYVTNDFVHVVFSRVIVPGDAELRIDYYPVGTPAGDIASVSSNLVTTTFDEFPLPADIAFEAATNYDFVVYTTWTPGPSVHTNGVLQLAGRQDMAGRGCFVPSRTGIYEDSVKLAPTNIVIHSSFSSQPPNNNEE